MKHIVLCADDFGQAEAISRGILQLIAAERLSATSCMVNGESFITDATKLRAFYGRIDIGLHLNLTEGKWLSGLPAIPLKTLLRRAFLGQLDRIAIIQECHAQLDRFYQCFGFLPDFVDGHQHIHQFPIIRNAILEVYEERLRIHQTYLRLVNTKLHHLKHWLIYATGTRAFQTLLKEHQIPHNHSFSGIYSFSEEKDYRQLFRKFLAESAHQGLLMCHPGDEDAHDLIAGARKREKAYLFSEQFLTDCHDSNVKMARFWTD
jgi:chitin disaccharide deacetylase